MTAPAGDDFPRQVARTRRFTLGEPRSFTIAPDGSRVVYLRTGAGDDPVTRLWCLDLGGDLTAGAERCVLDPGEGPEENIPGEERARRERVRERAGGIVAYSTDEAVSAAAAARGSGLAVVDLLTGAARHIDLGGVPIDPRLAPDGTAVAWVREGGLWVSGLDDPVPRNLIADEDPDVTWGLAEFVAGEEMGRTRGFWWSPDSQSIAVARVDVGPVQRWHLADPADPAVPATVLRYPAAGTANARVDLAVVGLDGRRTDVAWDAQACPYLVDVVWERGGPLTIVVQTRDQRGVEVRTVEPATGVSTLVTAISDDHWVDIVPGVPRWSAGRLVHLLDRDGSRRLTVDDEPVTPPGLHVRRVVHVGETHAVITGSGDDPTEVSVCRVALDGTGVTALTPDDGVHDATAAGDVVVLQAAALDGPPRTVVRRPGGETPITSHAETPAVRVAPTLLRLGSRALAGALLLPADHDPGSGPLPVVLDPYGGPHAQRVLRSRNAFALPQWIADQGYAVLVIDGRGSPGRGPAWERAVAGDLATAPLQDQVDAVHAAAEASPGLLDLGRVAIRGWSFGGFLAALAVIRRPDVFAAAIAGAPVTDWTLYDTHYTERYLGMPHGDSAARYRRSSLLEEAHALSRPLLLIHGLADDNVVAAHTLRLSAALLAAGRPHSVLPLPGVTHMTTQVAVEENLLRLQLGFLDTHLKPRVAAQLDS